MTGSQNAQDESLRIFCVVFSSNTKGLSGDSCKEFIHEELIMYKLDYHLHDKTGMVKVQLLIYLKWLSSRIILSWIMFGFMMKLNRPLLLSLPAHYF